MIWLHVYIIDLLGSAVKGKERLLLSIYSMAAEKNAFYLMVAARSLWAVSVEWDYSLSGADGWCKLSDLGMD